MWHIPSLCSESMQVHWLSSWLSRANTGAFLWLQLTSAERCVLVCKGCTHVFSALPALWPPQLRRVLCVLLASLSQACYHKTCYQVLTRPLKEARTAVGPRGEQWRQVVVSMCVQWCRA